MYMHTLKQQYHSRQSIDYARNHVRWSGLVAYPQNLACSRCPIILRSRFCTSDPQNLHLPMTLRYSREPCHDAQHSLQSQNRVPVQPFLTGSYFPRIRTCGWAHSQGIEHNGASNKHISQSHGATHRMTLLGFSQVCQLTFPTEPLLPLLRC